MSDQLTSEERRLIDRHLKAVGVTRCPAGRFSENVVSLLGGGKNSEEARWRAARRLRRFASAQKDRVRPVPSASTRVMIEMAKTKTAKEIGAVLGLHRNSVSTRLRAHGVAPVPQSVRDEEARAARRKPIAAMMAEGRSSAQIAEATGVPAETIRDDIAALIKLGATRVTPKSGRKITPVSEARRERVRQMMGKGLSLAHMAEITGVSKTTIRWDIQMLKRQGAKRVYAKPGRKPLKFEPATERTAI